MLCLHVCVLHACTPIPHGSGTVPAYELIINGEAAMAELKRCVIDKLGPCVVVRLVSENEENRLNPEFLQEYNKALDQVERYRVNTCISDMH